MEFNTTLYQCDTINYGFSKTPIIKSVVHYDVPYLELIVVAVVEVRIIYISHLVLINIAHITLTAYETSLSLHMGAISNN